MKDTAAMIEEMARAGYGVVFTQRSIGAGYEVEDIGTTSADFHAAVARLYEKTINANPRN
jgi:hypothetical protein